MKRSTYLMLMGTMLTVSAWADSLSFLGNGRGGTLLEPLRDYATKVEVAEAGELKYNVTESWTGKDGKPVKETNRFELSAKDGSLKIYSGEVQVGCGFCFDLIGEDMQIELPKHRSPGEKYNRWCDYQQQTKFGPLHINKFYSGATDKVRVHRIGSLITPSGVERFTDTLTKQ